MKKSDKKGKTTEEALLNILFTPFTKTKKEKKPETRAEYRTRMAKEHSKAWKTGKYAEPDDDEGTEIFYDE